MEHVGGLAIDQLEIYAPDVLREQNRRGRWIAATEVERGLPSARLCRPKLANARAYDRPYYLGHFRHSDGRLSLQRQASKVSPCNFGELSQPPGATLRKPALAREGRLW